MLRTNGIPAIAGVDTRALARHLRTTGSLRGIIMAPGELDETAAIAEAGAVQRWEDQDFVGQVSPGSIADVGGPDEAGPLVAIVDYGLKSNIVRSMRRRGARVRILPHTISTAVALAPDVDGVILSPGPGDPARLDGPVALARAVIEDGRPLLGICLGHQVVARAAGAETTRLRFGHHGANHPVQDLETGHVFITSQNHGFAVDESDLPSTLKATHRSLFDGTLQGIARIDKPAFSFQGHPEASPGPQEMGAMFDRFIHLMLRRLQQKLRARTAGKHTKQVAEG